MARRKKKPKSGKRGGAAKPPRPAKPAKAVAASDLRRGISPGEIPYESVVRILEAGRSSPSAANLQPWVFLVVREAEMKARLARVGSAAGEEPYRELFWRDEMHDPAECITSCGAVIAVFGENRMPLWRESCWAAVSRMEHAALVEGLVAIAYQPGDGRSLVGIFGVPEVYSPVALIAVGLPDGTMPVTTRKPLDTIAMEYRLDEPNRPIGSDAEDAGK